MYKQQLLNAIVDEMKICKRLYTKIPEDQMDFRPKEDMRSINELLQYLGVVGTAVLNYWLNEPGTDFFESFDKKAAVIKHIPHHQFLSVMDEQIVFIKKLFDQVDEADLLNTEVNYPWGGKAAFGEAIIAASIKFLTGYKLQLFLCIRMCSQQKLGTADAWFITEMD